jgi:VWFA-related protein
MSPTRVSLPLALLVLLTPQCLPAQQSFTSVAATSQSPAGQLPQPAASDIPTIRTTSRLVVLNVVVTDTDGNPIKGLKPSTFTLREDGVPQKLTSVTEFSSSPVASVVAAQPLPPNTFAVQPLPSESVTKTIIVLDQLQYPNYPLVRDDIYAFLRSAPAGNPTAIIRLDWQGLHLVQDFTTDPETLRRVVASDRMQPPIPSIDAATPHGSAGGPPVCSVPYTGVNDAYRRLASYIAGIPGRINLAWITDQGGQGVTPETNFPDVSTLIHDLNGTTDVLRIGRVVPYLIKAGGAVGGMLQPLEAPELVAKSVIPIPHADAVDPKCPLMPAAMGSIFANRDLSDLAAGAGGHAFFDGPREALTRIAATNSSYYTISYVPSNPNWNGKFRKIKVDIAGLPDLPIKLSELVLGWTESPGPKIFYRPGYYARSSPNPAEFASFGSNAAVGPEPPSPNRKLISVSPRGGLPPSPVAPFTAAMGFGVTAPAQLQFTVQVTPATSTEVLQPGATLPKDNFLAVTYRSQPYRNDRIHYWIDPQSLKFTRTSAGAYRDNLQFAVIVYGDDGLAVNSISATAHIQVSADDLETILASGVTFDQTIAIPAIGNFYLRSGVLEASTGHIGALEVPAAEIKLPPPSTLAVTTPEHDQSHAIQ